MSSYCENLMAESDGVTDEAIILRDSYCKIVSDEFALIRCNYPGGMEGWRQCYLLNKDEILKKREEQIKLLKK